VGGAEEGGRNGAPAGISALLSRAWAASTAGKTEALLGRDIRAIGGNVGTRFGSDWVGVYAVTRATDAAFQQAAQTLLFNIVGRPDFPDARSSGRSRSSCARSNWKTTTRGPTR
jgi:hypothetical protein